MPFTPDSPTVETALVPVTRVANVYQIHEINMSFTPNNIVQTSIYVKWSKGFNDDSGQYIIAEENSSILRGDPLMEKFAELVRPKDSNYVTVKKAIWSYLIEQGLIPSGTVS